jgi:glycosyltransferase involved in cell wall biosynthesis
VSKTLLVIPHYNDADRLEPFLKSLVEVLPSHFSILVSDDGSASGQRERLNQIIGQYTSQARESGPRVLPPLFVEENTGKGGAVRRGWDYGLGREVCEFSLLAFADADGAVSAGEIVRAERHVRQNDQEIDALFGSRVKMLGRTVTRSLKRHLSGRIFATLVSWLGNVPAYDTQCGIKILKTDTYRKIRPGMQTLGFAFDVELCLLLQASENRMIEFPIDWHDVPGSKVSLIRDSILMGIEVVRISRCVQSVQPN